MLKLMLVDDEPGILHGIAKMIERRSDREISMTLADSAAQALELCAVQCPDLIITDIYMPEMDGFELIEQVTQRFLCRRFAILSGYNDFELARKALHVKTLEYLTKPVNTGERMRLLETVERDVEEERQTQQRQFVLALRGALLYGLLPEEATLRTPVAEAWQALPYATVVSCDSPCAALSQAQRFFAAAYLPEPEEDGAPLLVGASAAPCDEAALRDALRLPPTGRAVGVSSGPNRWEGLRALARQSRENASYDAFFTGGTPLDAALSSPVEVAKAYLHAHYREDVTLEALADSVRLHPNYLSTLFKKETGLSFRQYLNRYRILRASEQILLRPDVPFEALAAEVGYDNPRQFFKMFKEHTGLTPGQYRHQGGKP